MTNFLNRNIVFNSVDDISIGFYFVSVPVNLCKAWYSGFYEVTNHKFVYFLYETFCFCYHMRSWSYYRHISFEYIPKLRKLINTCFTHQSSYFGYSRVIFGYLMRMGYIIQSHRPEFITVKFLVIKSVSLLFKKYTSF